MGLEGRVGGKPIVSRPNRSDRLISVKGNGIHILEPNTDSAGGARSTGKGSMATTASGKLAASQTREQNCSADFRVFGRAEDTMRLNLFLLHGPE